MAFGGIKKHPFRSGSMVCLCKTWSHEISIAKGGGRELRRVYYLYELWSKGQFNSFTAVFFFSLTRPLI